jgi:hypothetical protein
MHVEPAWSIAAQCRGSGMFIMSPRSEKFTFQIPLILCIKEGCKIKPTFLVSGSTSLQSSPSFIRIRDKDSTDNLRKSHKKVQDLGSTKKNRLGSGYRIKGVYKERNTQIRNTARRPCFPLAIFSLCVIACLIVLSLSVQ